MSVNEVTIDKMTAKRMTIGKLFEDKMTVDE